MDTVEKSVPVPDPVTAFYWEAAAREELVVQGFAGTDVLQFPPEPVAMGVTGPVGDSIAVPVSGRGRLYAFTVLHQAFHPAYTDAGPLIMALTELDDAPGTRILTNLVEVEPSELVVDMPLEVVFEARGDHRIPQFRPVREARAEESGDSRSLRRSGALAAEDVSPRSLEGAGAAAAEDVSPRSLRRAGAAAAEDVSPRSLRRSGALAEGRHEGPALRDARKLAPQGAVEDGELGDSRSLRRSGALAAEDVSPRSLRRSGALAEGRHEGSALRDARKLAPQGAVENGELGDSRSLEGAGAAAAEDVSPRSLEGAGAPAAEDVSPRSLRRSGALAEGRHEGPALRDASSQARGLLRERLAGDAKLAPQGSAGDGESSSQRSRGVSRPRAAVVGVGYSSIHREKGVDCRPLAVEACRTAIADAGLSVADVDGIFEYAGDEGAQDIQRMLGIDNLSTYADYTARCPSAITAALGAEMAVLSGACDVALVVRSVTREWGTMSGRRVPSATGRGQFELPYGVMGGVIPVMGMRKQRRLAEFGLTEDHYAHLSVGARKWSALNDRAVLRDPITVDDYFDSRYVAEPLRLFDCDYPVTGACAVVITTAERAADLAQCPVVIDASSMGTGRGADWTYTPDFVFGGTRACADNMWRKASVTPADIDVAELYDGFTHIAISWTEALGICGLGELGDWVDKGHTIAPGGALPLNTTGGQLAEGRLHGLSFLAEAVLQLRGETGERQVPDAEVAVVANGFGPQCASMVLTR